MTEKEPSLNDRLAELEGRVRLVEEQLARVVAGLNEPPKRSLRHPFASIHDLQVQVVEVDQAFHHLIDELHRPSTSS